MPATVGAYWGTQQFARDLPLPYITTSSTSQSFEVDVPCEPPYPVQVGDTLIAIVGLRADASARITSFPSGFVLVAEYGFYDVPGDPSRIYCYRKPVTGPETTTYHFIRSHTGFMHISIHAVKGAGPIEHVTWAAPPAPKAIPAITTTKPNCLLICGYTAKRPLDEFIPMPPSTPEWEGIDGAYYGEHWNAYQRDAIVEGTYGPTPVGVTTAQDQYLVMAVTPIPAPPTPDLTVTNLEPASGVIAGGTTVTVTGTSFALGATSVTIGATTIPAASVTVTSGTTLTFVTPAGPGAVTSVQAVTVTVGAYTSAVTSDTTFTYNTTGGFSPANVSDLLFWVDSSQASTVSTSGSTVTQWRDLSINRFVLNPLSAPVYTGTLNGLTTMTWTADYFQATTKSIGGQPRTYCWVMSPATGQQAFFSQISANPGIESTTAGNLFLYSGQDRDTGIPVAGVHVWTVLIDSHRSKVWKDGVQVWTENPGTNLPSGQLQIGNNPGYYFQFTGLLPEVAIYDAVLADTDRAAVENYLFNKWATISAPAAPVLTAATPGNTVVDLAWTAPANGGSAITDYIIEKSPNGTSTWTTVTESVSTATTYTVTGLTNGTIQYFRVKAVNAVGTGPVSNVLSATPAAVTVPGAPTLNTATPGDGSVALAWTAPASNGGSAITNYSVQYRTTAGPGSWNTFTHGSTATTTNVTGLTNATSYDFHVAAINTVGTGSYSSNLSATPTAPPAGDWTYEFDLMPVAPAPVPGWTHHDGSAPAIVAAGFRSSDAGWTRCYSTAANVTTENQKVSAGVSFDGFTSTSVLWLACALTLPWSTTVFYVILDGSGAALQLSYQFGGVSTGPTWTVPVSPFEVELEINKTTATAAVKINGTTLWTPTLSGHNWFTYGTHAALFVQAATVHKLLHENL